MPVNATSLVPLSVAKWPSIPRAKRLNALRDRNVAVARADQTLPDGYTSRVDVGHVLAIDVTLPP